MSTTSWPTGLACTSSTSSTGLNRTSSTGRLYNGQEDCSDCLESVVAQAADVEQALQDTGLAPLEVHPVMVFSRCGADMAPKRLGRLTIVGIDHLLSVIRPGADRLPPALVAAVRERLEAAFIEPESTASPSRPSQSRRAGPSEAVEQLLAFDLTAIDTDQLAAAAALSLEQWMVWLDPSQHQHVRRSWSGAARVRGAAGTGKTVLALHRAAYLAERSPGRVLVTSYVRTLPPYLAELYSRLSPHTAHRVDFVGLHSRALRVLGQRGLNVTVDGAAIDTAFNLAWLDVGKKPEAYGLARQYCREEIDAVIKGRDLRTRSLYLAADRPGRRTPLGAEQRSAVFDLYEAYQCCLAKKGLSDFTDVLRCARDVLNASADRPYAHVIADEVQDLPTVGLQLLRALVAEGPDDLLLVGDGQQTIYPGGSTLKAADIFVTGRAVKLTVNYRNPRNILDAAMGMVANDRYDDLEAADESPQTEVDTSLPDGRLVTEVFDSEAALERGLLVAMGTDKAAGIPTGCMAVLVSTNAEASHLAVVLKRAGYQPQPLGEFTGTTGDTVKVGTVKRAKGLEFDAVYLPGFDRSGNHLDDDERARRRREAFVAMTRARASLWIGTVRTEPLGHTRA